MEPKSARERFSGTVLCIQGGMTLGLAFSLGSCRDAQLPVVQDTQSTAETGTSPDTQAPNPDTADTSLITDSGEDTATPGPLTAGEAVEAITQAAAAFLSSLGETQLDSVQFDLEDPARHTWSNLPLSVYTREGLLTGDLDETQLALFETLLETSLSSQGYTQAVQIMAVDEIHREHGNKDLGQDLYSMSIFGEPSNTEPWSWQFDGHHLCFTFTIHTDQVSMSPALWGIQPVLLPDDAGDLAGVRVLGDEIDSAFALMNSLTESQQELAIVTTGVSGGIVGGPDNDDYVVAKERLGLSAAEMSAEQQELLLQVARTYILDLEEPLGALELAEVEADVESLYFAWVGSTEADTQVYFRIFGPTVLIELDHIDGASHVHTVYRDPANDYGESILARHYARFPH